MELGAGTVIEKYEIVERLGEGGMATVFKARHTLLGSMHAIKVLDPTLVANDDLRGRFLAEGRVQAQLRHPAIVAVTDVIAVPGVAALVAEFVDGPPLDVWIEQNGGCTDPDRIRAVFLPLLDGLGHAHAAGVVHRDIKPANILLEHGKHARIVDFGIAKVASEAMRGRSRRTRTGAVMGTLAYMSPEQVKGSVDIDHRSDLFSLAATLYEFVSGELPFDGATDFDTMKQIVEGAPRPLRERVPGVDPAMHAAIERGLARDPSDRFQTCEEFARALDGLGVGSARPSAPRGTLDLGAAAPSALDSMTEGLSTLGRGAAALAREGGRLAADRAARVRELREAEAARAPSARPPAAPGARPPTPRPAASVDEPPHWIGPAFLNFLCVPGMGHAVYRDWRGTISFVLLSVLALFVDALMNDAWAYEGPVALGLLKIWAAFSVVGVHRRRKREWEASLLP